MGEGRPEGTKLRLVSFDRRVADFKERLEHGDASRVTKADVIAWKNTLLDRGLSAKTINDGYLASIRTL